MPDIDGIETAELIRKHGRTSHTPIIFVTAYADEMQTERGYELGAVDYILTPVVPAILRSKVRVFVDLYRAQRRARRSLAPKPAGPPPKRRDARSDLIALASRELAASLNLESSMERLLEVLVPTRRRLCVARRVDGGSPTRVRYRQDASPRGCVEHRAGHAAADAAPRDDGSSDAAAMRSRCASTAERRGHWPGVLRFAHVLPLNSRRAQRSASCRSACRAPSPGRSTSAGCSRSPRAPRSRSTTRSSTAAWSARWRARKEAEEKLQEANRRKDEFLAMLSHELRNPLAPIAARLQVLAQDRARATRA